VPVIAMAGTNGHGEPMHIDHALSVEVIAVGIAGAEERVFDLIIGAL